MRRTAKCWRCGFEQLSNDEAAQVLGIQERAALLMTASHRFVSHDGRLRDIGGVKFIHAPISAHVIQGLFR
jgi:hypothetical protein